MLFHLFLLPSIKWQKDNTFLLRLYSTRWIILPLCFTLQRFLTSTAANWNTLAPIILFAVAFVPTAAYTFPRNKKVFPLKTAWNICFHRSSIPSRWKCDTMGAWNGYGSVYHLCIAPSSRDMFLLSSLLEGQECQRFDARLACRIHLCPSASIILEEPAFCIFTQRKAWRDTSSFRPG
jgi:hypothetical protein